MARSSTTGRFTSPKFSPNQTSARAGLSATWQLRGVEELSAKASAAEPNIGRALEAAHEQSAIQMQEEIIQALQDKIEERGRVQRPTQYLINALRSSKLRQVTIRGFTIGGFDRLGEESSVKLYARNLEIGTDVHKGQRLVGMFLTGPGGSLRRPSADLQTDMRFIKFKDTGPRTVTTRTGKTAVISPPRAVIENPIPAYHYFESGTAAFRESHGLVQLDFYEQYLAPLGVDFLTRWVSRHGGSGPTGSNVTLRSSAGRG